MPTKETLVRERGAGSISGKRGRGRPRKSDSVAGAGKNAVERVPARTEATASMLDSSRADVAEEGATRTNVKCKSSRPKSDGALAGSSPSKSGAGGAGSSPANRPPAQPIQDVFTQGTTLVSMSGGGTGSTTEKRKRGRPRKDRGSAAESQSGKSGGGSAGGNARKRPPAQHGTNKSPHDPSQTVKNESTQETSQAGVLATGKSGLVEKRKRGRPRKDGGSSSPRGRVGVGGTTNSVEKRAHAQAGTDGSNVGTGSSQASGTEEGASNIAQKRKPGRPRKDEASSNSQEKVVLSTNSTGKRANAQPGTDESKPSSTQERRNEGGVSTSKGKRSLGWTTKDGATSDSTSGDVGVDGANCSTVQRPDPRPGREKMAGGSHEEVMVKGGWKDPNLVKDDSSHDTEEGSKCVKEKFKLNRDTLPDAQHESRGNGGANVSDWRKPSQSWEEEAIRGALRQFIAADGASCSVGKSNSDRLEGDKPISIIPEKNMPGRPKKHAEASNAPLHKVNEGGSDYTGKRKPGRPKKDGAMLEDGSGSSAGKRKPGRPKKDGAMLEDGAGSSAGKRKPGRPKKDGAMLEDGSGSSAGKRKPGRPKKHGAMLEDGSGSNAGKGKPGRPKKHGAMLEDGSSSSAGKRKRGRPKKNAAASETLRNNVAGDASSSSAGKRQSGDATNDERPSRDDVAGEGVGGNKGKRKAGRPKKRDTMSPIGQEDAIGMDVGSNRTKKHKANRTTKLEVFSAAPGEDIAENGASITPGMPKPVGAKKNEIIPDAIEKGGASNSPGEPQAGQTVEKEPVRDALPARLPGHVTAEHKPGRRNELELSPETSRFANKSVANGIQLTQRRGRGRPRKDAGVVDGRYEPDQPAPAVCPPSKKQRTASGAAATARNEDDGHNEPEGDPVTSGMDDEHPNMSPSHE